MVKSCWSDGICLAWHKKNNKRCHYTTNKNSDFCQYHHEYDEKFLEKRRKLDKKQFGDLMNDLMMYTIKKVDDEFDEKWSAGLIGMYESWKEIPIEERIILDNGCYVVPDIIHLIESSLNSSDMGNPLPIFPSNPYTRQPFTKKSLFKLYCRVQDLGIPLGIATWTLFNNLHKDTKHLRAILEKSLRFCTINLVDSQNNYLGYWTYKNTPTSYFEEFVNLYKATPPLIDDGLGGLMENYSSRQIKEYMKSFPEETVTMGWVLPDGTPL